MSFYKDKHVGFVKQQDENRLYEYWLSEHLRMNGLYWGIMSLATMGELLALNREEVEQYILSCWHDDDGGFGAFPRHDAHVLSTLSALQVLKIYDQNLDQLSQHQKLAVTKFLLACQMEDGLFQGDRFGEVDTRFSYVCLMALALLGQLTSEVVDPGVEFIMRCQNFDGGFGLVPGSESHAAQVLVCVAALAVVDRLDLVENDTKLATWLSERQNETGGFNGRPEKLEDVCYSWWVLSSLAIIKKMHWVDLPKLEQFILLCQDPVAGGFSDRPDNQTDIYHTCFGINGLSLIDYNRYNFHEVDPVYCMPKALTQHFEKWRC